MHVIMAFVSEYQRKKSYTFETLTRLLSFHLVRHPRIMEKLRAEVSQLSPNQNIDRTALRELKYLQNVMKESE